MEVDEPTEEVKTDHVKHVQLWLLLQNLNYFGNCLNNVRVYKKM
jgi:hypothetical protein